MFINGTSRGLMRDSLSAAAALQSIGVRSEEGRLCWTQVEMQVKSAQVMEVVSEMS